MESIVNIFITFLLHKRMEKRNIMEKLALCNLKAVFSPSCVAAFVWCISVGMGFVSYTQNLLKVINNEYLTCFRLLTKQLVTLAKWSAGILKQL